MQLDCFSCMCGGCACVFISMGVCGVCVCVNIYYAR